MLNPWAGIIALAKLWCMLEPGTKMAIGLPAGPDTVVYNRAKVYGPVMTAHLLANWRSLVPPEVDMGLYNAKCLTCYIPIRVLEKR